MAMFRQILNCYIQSDGRTVRIYTRAIWCRSRPLITIAAIGVVTGFLIGGVGIGGVILVPALTYLVGIDIRIAIATALMSFIATGVIGTVQYQKHGSIEWPAACVLAAAAVPAIILGSLMVSIISPLLLTSLIGAFAAFSGLQAIVCQGFDQAPVPASPSPRRLAMIGAVTGFFSTLSGTGGPLLLVPILIWQRQRPLSAIGLSQVIQLPISIVATLTNLSMSAVDLRLGALLALTLSAGCWAGASLAHSLDTRILRLGASYLLIAFGVALIIVVGGAFFVT